jgi:hypothetical protein
MDKSFGKRQIAKSGKRCKNKIRMDLRETGYKELLKVSEAG